jgi:probable rRNA maturation factor
MIEPNRTDVAPAPAQADGVGDGEPGPGPAGVVVLSDMWHDLPGAVAAVHEAVDAAMRFVPTLGSGEIAIALSSDAAVRELNGRFRGQDKPTNVLSFPAAPGFPGVQAMPSGDIVIAYETVLREAAADDKPALHHLAHLTVHGLLHLAGYDHDDDADAETMERLEQRILASLAIPDPYRSDVEQPQPLAGQVQT